MLHWGFTLLVILVFDCSFDISWGSPTWEGGVRGTMVSIKHSTIVP